jgi:lysyl-tRNA synthetase class II
MSCACTATRIRTTSDAVTHAGSLQPHARTMADTTGEALAAEGRSGCSVAGRHAGQACHGEEQLCDSCRIGSGRIQLFVQSAVDSARRLTRPSGSGIVGDIVGATGTNCCKYPHGRAVGQGRECAAPAREGACVRCPRSGTALRTRSSGFRQRYVDLIVDGARSRHLSASVVEDDRRDHARISGLAGASSKSRPR